MSNLQQTTEKTTFEKFYQGWPHFNRLMVYPDMVVFQLPTPKQAVNAYEKAQQRINELCLPLVAETTGKSQNTFIIKSKA